MRQKNCPYVLIDWAKQDVQESAMMIEPPLPVRKTHPLKKVMSK